MFGRTQRTYGSIQTHCVGGHQVLVATAQRHAFAVLVIFERQIFALNR